ncbi:NUDIX hydrolase [Paludibacterium yongneupense]|uniref:NUDIX hydrolase n=1 Tax=Paludibacterium yongneupense TaxID=400061 RepID=UPI0003FE3C46|nr:NUDIX domain-containing protein [Paludibacterium yongneupense]
MRRRLCAKLLILDPQQRVLLCRGLAGDPAPAQDAFWTPPGGGLDEGESFEQAARRALQKNTGIVCQHMGAPVAEHTYSLPLADGDRLLVDERYFLIRAEGDTIAERVMSAEEFRWWDSQSLNSTTELIVPENLGLTLAGLIAN